jgi:hypothetical protein
MTVTNIGKSMTTNDKLNDNGLQLRAQLMEARVLLDNSSADLDADQIINVAGVGTMVSTAYEQLRNAAEYAQEHLLMQKAMRRFYVRNLSFQNKTTIKKAIAEELIIELTQSGYISNNSQPIERIDELKAIIHKHYDNYWRLKEIGVDNHTDQNWTLDLLSVEAENAITKDTLQTAYIQFVYRHYQTTLRKDLFIAYDSDDNNYETSLYVSAYRALLKSDIAIVRYDMQKLYKVSDANIEEYRRFHENIDTIFSSDLTNKITRYINKYGAPLRVLRSMIRDDDDISRLLGDKESFDIAYSEQIEKEYHSAESKLNRGLIKSVVFLLITKSLIGIAIEVPYDLMISGVVVVTPLVINLFAPVIYMALLRVGIKLPGRANAKAIRIYADNMLYKVKGQVNLHSKIKDKRYPAWFTVVYAIMFLVVFGVVSKLLIDFHFNIIQGGIFFVFFAAASFLGFRLSRIVQELEVVTETPGTITAVRDFLFMPFTMTGKWISEKYQKINFVALILDTIIELPLKTVLRLIRQWTGFIDDKKDEI